MMEPIMKVSIVHDPVMFTSFLKRGSLLFYLLCKDPFISMKEYSSLSYVRLSVKLPRFFFKSNERRVFYLVREVVFTFSFAIYVSCCTV